MNVACKHTDIVHVTLNACAHWQMYKRIFDFHFKNVTDYIFDC